MEEILKVVTKKELTDQYIKIEYCGSSDSNLEEYYYAILKSDKDRFIQLLGPETEAERIDLEQRLVANGIKDFILEHLDSFYDSLTAHFLDVYGGVDEFLMHYGYLECTEDPMNFYSEADVYNDFNIDEPIEEEPKFEVHMYDEVEEMQEVEEPAKPEIIPEPVITPQPAKPVVMTSEDELNSEMLKVIIEELHLDFDRIKAKAESRIEARMNPEIDEDQLNRTLDYLIDLGVYSETDKEMIKLSYKSGNRLEVTNLLGKKCLEVSLNGR